MKNDAVSINPERLRLEANAAVYAEESGVWEEHVEFPTMVLGDAWSRTQTSAREFAVSPRPSTVNRHELVLSGAQLMFAVGSAFTSIFLFVWALINLWLTES